jgi:hypothetical protein
MYIVITIDTENAAFDDGQTGRETARILRDLADKYEDGDYRQHILHDINGNSVGNVRYTGTAQRILGV